MDTDQAPSKNSKNSGKSFEQICEENDFRGELLSTTAHSLRTSLSAIKWTLQMFLDKDFGEITPEQENMLKKTFENNDRMISIVNDMIKVNKSMDHTQNTENESVDVVELLESLAFDFNAESFKNGVSIVFNKPQTDCFIKSNTEKLRLIFSNLIENAIKYSSAGNKIYINISDAGESFMFSIKDTGIGVPEKEKPHLFEKFYRATNAVAKEPTGSGIGLYTVKKIVEALGGTVDFESDQTGTTFNITLKKQP